MDLINQFIENYKKKVNFYEIAGRVAARQLEAALQSAGIRAIVTSRAKNPGRLKSKVLIRNSRRAVPYKNMRRSTRTSRICPACACPSTSRVTATRPTS